MREECDFGDLQREVAFLLVIPEWFLTLDSAALVPDSVFPSFSIGIERAVPRICRCREFSGLGIVVRSWRQSPPPRSGAIPPSSVGIDPAFAAGVRIGCSRSLSYGRARLCTESLAAFDAGGPGGCPYLSQPLSGGPPISLAAYSGAFGVDETMKPLAVFHTGGPGCAPSLSQPLMRAGLVDGAYSPFGVDETILSQFFSGPGCAPSIRARLESMKQ